MSHSCFTERSVLTGSFKHFKGGNFVAARKTHSLIFVASTDEFTGSKRKKHALPETLVYRSRVVKGKRALCSRDIAFCGILVF